MSEAQSHPVSLPKIDDAVLEEFHDTPLIEFAGYSNPQWSQLAVDFACRLNRASTKPEVAASNIKPGGYRNEIESAKRSISNWPNWMKRQKPEPGGGE